MSVRSEIDRISSGVANTYNVLEGLGATMPETCNVDNLAETARTIPTGSGTVSGLPEVTVADNGKHLEVVDGVWAVVEQGDGLEKITVLEETTIELIDGSCSSTEILLDTITVGEIYIVVFDGVEYTCEAFSLNGMSVLGNLGIIGLEDTGEPFLLAVSPGYGFEMICYNENSTTCTLAIYTYGEPTTSWNDLSDRPFGENITESVIIPETPVSFKIANLPNSVKAYTIDGAGYDTFIAGDTIKVVLEGVEYICTAFETQMVPWIGDATLIGGASNGEPFLIGCNPEDGTLSIYVFIVEDESVETKKFTIGITKQNIVVKHLDEKFIPDSVKMPAVTEDDEGKFLSVVNGVWSLVSLTNGNEVAY